MNNIKDDNIQKNLLELENSLSDGEIIKGYFESLNYSAEKERKSPISGPNTFKYLFVDEWIWNTIFVLTNKKLYLINTREDFSKVSLNAISLEDIEFINIMMHNEKAILELKIKGEYEIQYKPFSNDYLDVIRNLDNVDVFENKEFKQINANTSIALYATFCIIILAIIIISYIN